MVFPSDVVGEEDNDDGINFQQVLASAKAKYLKQPKKTLSVPQRNFSNNAEFSQKQHHGDQKSLDDSAFSSRATARRRFATASRQFRPDIYGTAAREPASTWKDSVRTRTQETEGQVYVKGDALPIVSRLARRLLDAEQKPLVGPPKALLDKLNLPKNEFNAPYTTKNNDENRRHRNHEKPHAGFSEKFDNVEAETLPGPPQSSLTSTPVSQSAVAPPRGRLRVHEYPPTRNSDRSGYRRQEWSSGYEHTGFENNYDEEFDCYDAEPPEPVRKRKLDDTSKTEKHQLLKEHFEARAQLDAVMQEMQANGNFLTGRHDEEVADTPSSRKRAQAAKRYDSLQSEKFAGNKTKHVQKVESVAENDSQGAEIASEQASDVFEQPNDSSKPMLPRVQRMKKLKKDLRQRAADRQHEATTQGAYVTPKSARVLTKPPVALDCEFVGVGPLGIDDALARVSVVNEHGDVLYDRFVRAQEAVTDYRTEVSGVRPKDISAQNTSAIEFATAQRDVAELIAGRIVVGHAIANDLKALQLSHPRYYIRDTQTFMPYKRLGGASRPSLRKLAKAVLDLEIHSGTHDSIEDARVAMQLYMCRKTEWERQLANGETKHFGKKRQRQEEFNWHHGSKRLDRRMPRDERVIRHRRFKKDNMKLTGGNNSGVDDVMSLGVTSGTALDR